MPVSLNPFFESSLDLLCVANFDAYFVDVNPAFLRMTGFTKQELLSKKINDFVYEDDRQQTQKIREGLFDSQSIINFENRYRTKSGDLVWLSWSAVPLENKKVVYAIAKNITHQKILKNERLDELVKLIQQNEDLTLLNLITSHDLRSPMHSVLSLFNFIDYDEIENKETLQILKYIEIGAKGVKNSLDNYLDIMSNSRFGKVALEEVDLDDSLSVVINSIGSLIQNSNTTISSNFSSFQSVYFNKVFMQSIFLNLIVNAIKYTKPGVFPTLELFSSIEDEQKILVIRDNGRGVDLNVIGDKLFNLNQRFDSEEEGKGVGLYIVHNQLTSLGGEISVKSELNQGTTFTIKFKTN